MACPGFLILLNMVMRESKGIFVTGEGKQELLDLYLKICNDLRWFPWSIPMLNAIPVVGWLLDLIFKASLAFPFWLTWTVFGLGRKYFYFLPEVYHAPGFWECLGLFIAMPILYMIFVPKVVSVNQSNQNKDSAKEA